MEGAYWGRKAKEKISFGANSLKTALKYLIVSGYLQRDCLGGWDVVKAALWGELS